MTIPQFSVGESTFLLGGEPLQIRCGEVHAPRVPREYWRHRLQLVRENLMRHWADMP